MRLKKLRERRGLTKTAVARAVGVSRQAIGYYEEGKREPDVRMLKLLADFFECTIDYIVEHDVDLVQNISFDDLELLRNFRLLAEEEQDEILAIIGFKLSKKEKFLDVAR